MSNKTYANETWDVLSKIYNTLETMECNKTEQYYLNRAAKGLEIALENLNTLNNYEETKQTEEAVNANQGEWSQ
jgi:hypothetical protein